MTMIETEHKAQATNPLEQHVEVIAANANYLTPALIGRLQALLPDTEPKEKKRSLKGQLERMFRMLDRLDALSTSSENITEMKQVILAAKDLYNLVAKYQQTVSAEEKLQALENTIVDALEETDVKVKEKFLSMWKLKVDKLDRAT